jgi:hypothetical protein
LDVEKFKRHLSQHAFMQQMGSRHSTLQKQPNQADLVLSTLKQRA